MDKITKLAILEGLNSHKQKLEALNGLTVQINEMVELLTKTTYFMLECMQELTKEVR